MTIPCVGDIIGYKAKLISTIQSPKKEHTLTDEGKKIMKPL